MKQQLRLAICGTSRAGKDTFANVLEDKLVEMGFAKADKLAFADPLKQLYKNYFFYKEDKEKPRDAYVTIGNAMREVDEDVWINHLLIAADKSWGEGNSILVTDVRYENEAKVLMDKFGFILVKVDADGLIRKQRAESLGENLDLNNSGDVEVGFIKEDLLVINNGEDDLKQMERYAEIAINMAQEVANG